MKPIRLWAALIAAVSLATFLPAQNCSHTTVNAVGGSLKPFGVQPCTRGLTVTIHGLTLQLGHCPMWLLEFPAHHEPLPEPGCGTDAVIGGWVPVRRYPVNCFHADLWLIDLGGFCTVQAPFIVANVKDWTTQPCQ